MLDSILNILNSVSTQCFIRYPDTLLVAQKNVAMPGGVYQYRGPIRGFRDMGYSQKKLPGYRIFEEKVIGIQDIQK